MAQTYSVSLTRRANIFAGGMMQLPPTIALQPERWSARDIGGPETATIQATGTLDEMAMLLTWIGDRAEIVNEYGSKVWWGVIGEIEADLGGVTVSLGLDSVYNRVAVIYSTYLPDGSTQSATTAWAQDDNSIERYGKRELLYALPEGYSEAATAVRDRLLARLADPAPLLRSRGDWQVGATLHCVGVWQLLDNVYYTNDKGLVEHTDSSGQAIVGAAYSATTISFEDEDDVNDSANGLAALQAGVVFRVAGATQAANNGTFTVQSYDNAGHIETVENTQVDEVAGAPVTISIGDQALVVRVAQSFRIPSTTSWNAGKAMIRAVRVGSPTDALKIELCANSAGSPGTVLDSATIDGDDVYTEMAWTEFTFSNTVTLATGTDYWLVVSRTGSNSLSNYYVVALDEGLGYGTGTLKWYTGGAWAARTPDADMPFRVIGEAYSSTQLRETLEASDELTSVLVNVSSGVTVRRYRDTNRSIREEAEEMLDLGTNTGQRLVATVLADRTAVVDVAPDSTPVNPVLGRDGRLRHATGAPWEPGELVYGRYVNVDGLPVLDGVATRTKGSMALYIEAAEYDPTTDRLLLTSEGARNPWEALRLRNG